LAIFVRSSHLTKAAAQLLFLSFYRPLFLFYFFSSGRPPTPPPPPPPIISVLSMCVEEHGSSSVEFTKNHIKNQVGIIVFFISFDK